MNDPAIKGGDYCPCNTITFGEDGRVEHVKLSREHGLPACGQSVRHWTCDESVKHYSEAWEFQCVGVLGAQCRVYHAIYK